MDEQVDDDQREQDPPEDAAPGDSSDTPETAETPPPDAKRLITLAVPPIDQLLVLLGGAAMVLAGLLSWINVPGDAFPNFAGIGAGGGGVGLVVLLAGIALLSGRPRSDTANGVALGAFLASLVTVITLYNMLDGVGMGAGAYVATVGSFVALTGLTFATMVLGRRPPRHVENKAVATLGAILAIVASFWLDWVVLGLGAFVPVDAVSLDTPFALAVGGLDSDVATGYPVLFLSVLVLLLLLGLLSPTATAGMQINMAMHIRLAGIAIVVLGAGDLVGSVMGPGLTGSGPILALIGGLMIARSVGSAEAAGSETAGAEAA